MKLVSWNVNGYRACVKSGKIGEVFKDRPDIVCFQEVKLSDEGELFDFTYDGYSCYANLSNDHGRGGVAVLTLTPPKKIITKIGYERFDSEGRFIELEYDDYSVINVYMPHGQRDKANLGHKLEAYNSLYAYLSYRNRANVIIVGDFNIAMEDIDAANAKKNRKNIMFTEEEREKLCELKTRGFTDSFREKNKEAEKYSWWPYAYNARERNMGWRIDYIFISGKWSKMNYVPYIHNEIYGSDHCPVSIVVEDK